MNSLDPGLIAQVSGLRLSPRFAQMGSLWGQRVTARIKGVTSEFVDYRNYVPGEDPRRIDWKIYARTDRYYLRSFQGQAHCALRLILDASRSMRFSSRPNLPTKWEAAAKAATALAYVALKNQDACGLTLFASKPLASIEPRIHWEILSQITALLDAFDAFEEETKYQESLLNILEAAPRRSLFIVISDFLGASVEKICMALETMASLHHEVVAIRLLDPLEITLNAGEGDGMLRLKSVEREPVEALEIDSSDLVSEYAAKFQEEERQMEMILSSKYIELVRLRTDEDLGSALVRALSARGVLSRK